MTSILGAAIRKLLKQYQKSKEDMLSPLQFGQQMIDWTDQRRVLSNEFFKEKTCPHARLAIKLLKIAEKENASIVKTMCYLLNKLTLNDGIESIVIHDIIERAEELKENVNNTIAKNLLSKFVYYVRNIKVKQEEIEKEDDDEIKPRIIIKDEFMTPEPESNSLNETKTETNDTNLTPSKIKNPSENENENDKTDSMIVDNNETKDKNEKNLNEKENKENKDNENNHQNMIEDKDEYINEAEINEDENNDESENDTNSDSNKEDKEFDIEIKDKKMNDNDEIDEDDIF